MTATVHRSRLDITPFERISRQVRWLAVVVLLLIFPPGAPQSLIGYAAIGAAAVYNLIRYIPAVYRNRVTGSPIFVLASDLVLSSMMMIIVGTADTPFTGLLVLIVVSAAYRYGLRGVIFLTGIEAVLVALVTMHPIFEPLQLSTFRTAYSGVFVIVTIGVLAERLTRNQREERELLEAVSLENDVKSRRLLGLINSLNQAIFVLDKRGRVLLVNEAGRIMVPDQTDPTGQKLSRVVTFKRRNHPEETVDLLGTHDAPQIRRDLSITDSAGHVQQLDVSVIPVPAKDHPNAMEYVIVCRDITHEQTLDEQREEFISVASHELRTPLAITEAALSTALLDRKGLNERTANLLDKAHRNVVFLAGIVHDLTTLSAAQNDSIPIQLSPVSPAKLLEQLATDFAAEAERRGLKLVQMVSPDTPAVLSTEHHIHEILENFVTNALKYTQKGVVTLSAQPAPNGSVRFSVHDTGIGISPADQQHLFHKFFRAEDFRTRETNGTGMGLYLCLELAQRLNAKIWCESKLNSGSTFYLEVPPFSKLARDGKEVVTAQVTNLIDQL